MVVTSGAQEKVIAEDENGTDAIDSRFVDLLRANHQLLCEELRKYDSKKSGRITKSELRNALEAIAREPVSSRLFDKIVDGSSFAVDYARCLSKIGVPVQAEFPPEQLSSAPNEQNPPRLARSVTSLPSSAADIESTFKQKLQENVTKVLRGLRLFDYNRDCRIQKTEMKKTFDTHVMKLTDQQFDKLWSRYEVNHNSGTTTTNYQEFLKRLGVTNEQLASVGSGAKSEKTQNSQQVLTDSVVAAYAEHPASAASWRNESAAALRPLSSFRHVVRNEDLPNRSQHLSESNIDFLEDQLRSGVLANRGAIVKMFEIFDRDGTGYITLDELHKTVNSFVVQMAFPVFQQVMERFGLKASHTIAWRIFMRKFDPISYGEQQNGSFVPVRSNHRYFPPKGGDQKMSVNTLLTKLHEHIRNGYPSLKEAFLLIDETREGTVTASKLQKLLSDRVKLPVTDSQMSEIWGMLQPAGSPPLDYTRFVELFEIKDTADSHPWLNSCHRVNDFRHPAPLAGPQAAELLRQHAVTHWSTIAKDLGAADRQRRGVVKVSKLKSILTEHTGQLDDATFNKWINECSTLPGDEVNYREFFAIRGVEINPGDFEGLSLRIAEENELRIDQQIADQQQRQMVDSFKAAEHANKMSIEEVVVRLRDRFEQKTSNFYKTFTYFAKKRKQSYRLSRGGFRKMLSHMGFLLSDDNFNELCNRLEFTGNHMSYEDFVRSFEKLFFQAPSDVERTDNHRYNEIRGGEQLMDADQAYDLFEKKLLQNFDNLRQAFNYADVERRSVISEKGVIRLFDSLNIPLNPACIGEIMKKLAAKLKRSSISVISLDDFRDMFEFHEDERGHKWKSDHRFNKQVQGEFPTTPDGAFQMLMLKLRSQFNSPTEAFLAADPRRTGRITKRDLSKLLEKVHMMNIGEPLLSGLWDLIDPLREGSVKMEAFFRRSGVDNPGDAEGGVSEKIIAQSDATMDDMLRKMREHHQLATDRQAAVGRTLNAEMALATIGQKLVDSGQTLEALYAKFDLKKRGFLSPQQIQTILHTYHLFLAPDEEQRLFSLLGIGVNSRSAVTLVDFKAAFGDQQLVVGNEAAQAVASDHNKKAEIRFPPPNVNPNKVSYSTTVDIWKKARTLFSRHADLMQKAFAALDKSSSGRLPLSDFERVLSAFCGARVPLSFVRQRFPPSPDGTIDYRGFMSSVVTQNVPAVAASALLNLGSNEQAAGIRRLASAVRARHYQLITACEELDWSRYGYLSLQEFRNVLQQFTFPLTDQLFNSITSMPDVIPTNEDGNVLYREALSTLAADQILPAPSGEALPPLFNDGDVTDRAESVLPAIDDFGIARTARALSTVSSSRVSSTLASSVITDLIGFDDFGFGGLPMVDATQAESQLYPMMAKRWRRFHRACRAADPQQTGFLPTPAVDKIFQEIGMTLPDGEFQIVCRKYDLKNSGSFAYRHFLRQMVLTNKANGKTTSNANNNSSDANNNSSSLPNIRGLLSTAERWRDLRRWFRNQPQTSPGVISIGQLRHGLRTVTDSNMSEEDFAELTNRLDPQTTGYIRFDDLFRLALKSTTTTSLST